MPILLLHSKTHIMNSTYDFRLQLVATYWEHISWGATCMRQEPSEQALKIYQKEVVRDLLMLQKSLLCDMMFEAEHGIERDDVVERLKLANKIAFDLQKLEQIRKDNLSKTSATWTKE